MENLGSPLITVDGGVARKKRSSLPRRPNHNPKPLSNYICCSSSSSLLDNYGEYRDINEIYTNDYSRVRFGREGFPIDNYEDGLKDLFIKSDRLGNERKVKKVKLKVGGVTHTIQTKSMAEVAHSSGASAENDAEDFHGKGSSSAKMLSMRLNMGEESAGKGHAYNYLAVRKSKRVPKKRTLDEEFADEEDDEIRYLGKLQASKAAAGYRNKHENLESPDFEYIREYGSSMFDKADRRKSSLHEDKDYVEEEDPASDNELEDKKNKKEHLSSLAGGGNELTITTRKRALENGKGISPGSGLSVMFPDGLPAAPAKKMLPDVDQQLRKVEAAQRRRLQAEKAAKEAEAEAIRKILGQDSTRKKREEKLKRQQEELAEERTARAAAVAPNTVRWVMGPSGTVVTFSDDLGLPMIFGSLSSRYPPAREKCVGPDCNNEYKYRDSKSKLPLCSLHCYKAVQG